MTLKSSSSENKKMQENGRDKGKPSGEKQGGLSARTASLSGMIRQNIHGNLWLVLLGLLVMLFNYPVNMAVQLTDAEQYYMRNGFTVYSEVGAVSSALADSGAVSGAASVIGGADGPTSVFVAEKSSELSERITEIANNILLGNYTLIPFIVIVAAALCAFAMFRYLYSRQQVDYYHSLPVSRGRRFAANYLSGALIMAGSYLVGLLGAWVVAAVYQAEGMMLFPVLKVNLGYFLLFLFLYTVSIGAMLMAGNMAVGALSLAWIWGIGPAAAGILYSIKQVHIDTLYNASGPEQKLKYLSPIAWLIDYVRYPSILGEAGTVPSPYYDKSLAEAAKLSAERIFFVLLLTAAGIALTAFLYRRRASEATGSAISFRAVKAPVRIITTVLAALLCSLIGTELSLAWTIFFTVVSAVIVHAVMDAIMCLDIRKLFLHKLELFFCAVLSLGVVLLFSFDVMGWNRYVPETDQIESASVYADLVSGQYQVDATVEAREAYGSIADGTFYPLEDKQSRSYTSFDERTTSRMKLTDPKVLEAVRALAEAGVMQNETFGKDRVAAGETAYYTHIGYQLKNGRRDERVYYLPKEELMKLLPVIVASPEFKAASYPILQVAAKDAGIFGLQLSEEAREASDQNLQKRLPELTATVGRMYYFTGEDRALRLSGLSADFDERLLSALQKDLSNMNLSDQDIEWVQNLNDETGSEDYSYLIYIPLEEKVMAEERRKGLSAAERGVDDNPYWYYDVYPIFKSFTNVRELLSVYGFVLE